MFPDPKTTQCAVYVHTGILDMRVGFDRLAARIQEEYRRSAIQGGWYVFLSRTRDRVRIFCWDRDGYAMWTKRLEAGGYKVEKRDGYGELTAIDLASILEGTEL
jgi:transposase